MANYILLCEYCGWKLITDLINADVHELKNDTLSNKKYRCKKCGRAVAPKKFPDPQKDLERKQEEKRIEEDNKKWIEENIDFQTRFLKEDQDE